MSPWVPAALLGLAAAVAMRAMPPLRLDPPVRPVPADPAGWLRRYRALWAGLAASGAWIVLGGALGVAGAVVAAVACWLMAERAEPADLRARRDEVRRDLPVLVQLLGCALASGAAPGEALIAVIDALPGALAELVAPLVARLRLGADPAETWRALAEVPELAPLGRTLARAHTTGAPVAAAVDRLAIELADARRSVAEERARQVGVKAAVPLGVCLLPAFLLIGIVPVVGALMTGMGL